MTRPYRQNKLVTKLDGITYCVSKTNVDDEHIYVKNNLRGTTYICYTCYKNAGWSGGGGRRRHGEKAMSRTEFRKANICKTDVCSICKKYTTTVRDHDPKTGLFRGWLCHPCNQALFLLDHYYEATIAYLAATQQQASPES